MSGCSLSLWERVRVRVFLAAFAIAAGISPLNSARADCAATPISDPDDMVVSFLKANAVQAASASLFPSAVKEGMLVYDGSAKALKVCDGTDWQSISMGTASDPRIGTLTATKWCAVNAAGDTIDCTQNAPTTTSAAGSAGDIQYNDGSNALAANSGFNYSGPTWNNSGTIFTGLKLNITNTASATGSLLMDLQVGGSSRFSADKFGGIALNGVGTSASATITAYNTGGASGRLQIQRAAGTQTAPSLVPSGYALGRINMNGYDGSAFKTGAAISTIAEQDFSSTVNNAAMTFSTASGTTNAEHMRITSAGSVGVGTTSPQSTLDVNGGARVGADATCTAAKAGMLAWNSNKLQVCTDAGTFTDIASSSGGSSQWVNGTSGAIYYNGGNVGIGTTSPTASLHVKANTTSALGEVRFQPSTNDSETAGYALSFRNVSDSVEAARIVGVNNGPWLGNLRFYTLDSISHTTTERMRIDASGNVGIGTTTPSAPFEVNGSVSVSNFDNNPLAVFKNSLNASNGSTPLVLNTTHASAATGFVFKQAGTTKWDMIVDNDITFRDVPNSFASRLVLKSGGNVGIGTTSPIAKLQSDLGVGGTATIGAYVHASTDSGTFTDAANHVRSKASLVVGSQWGTNNANAALLNVYSGETDGVLYVKTNGNVGIGTTTPQSLLQVGSGGATTYTQANTLQVGNGASNALGVVGDATGSNINFYLNAVADRKASVRAVVGGTQGGQLVFSTKPDSASDVSERMRIDASGNVGIGTTSPSSFGKLAVTVGNGSTVGITTSSGASGAAGGFQLNSYYGGVKIGYIDNELLDGTSGSEKSLLRFATIRNGTLTEAVRIDNSGNVGIGTTSPAGVLDVKTPVNGDANQPRFLSGSTSAGDTNEIFLGAGIGSYRVVGLRYFNGQGTAASSYLCIFNYGDGCTLNVVGGGNVGIGTTSPSFKLDVASTGITWAGRFRNTGGTGGAIGQSGGVLGTTAVGGSSSVGVYGEATNGGFGGYFTSGSNYANLPWNGAGWATASDKKLKTDINEISGPAALAKLSQIRGVSYKWKTHPESGEHLGVIAQEVEKVFPQLVRVDHITGNLNVEYNGLIAPLISAVNELKADNDNLRAELKAANDNYRDLRQELDALKTKIH